mmetsp:Transcript_11061/g.47827  ORF Transcript_11061/g.47827 Transcript_11061/m.47827 type:complete len:311 (-) Transcript_11061:626-1558(-)
MGNNYFTRRYLNDRASSVVDSQTAAAATAPRPVPLAALFMLACPSAFLAIAICTSIVRISSLICSATSRSLVNGVASLTSSPLLAISPFARSRRSPILARSFVNALTRSFPSSYARCADSNAALVDLYSSDLGSIRELTYDSRVSILSTTSLHSRPTRSSAVRTSGNLAATAVCALRHASRLERQSFASASFATALSFGATRSSSTRHSLASTADSIALRSSISSSVLRSTFFRDASRGASRSSAEATAYSSSSSSSSSLSERFGSPSPSPPPTSAEEGSLAARSLTTAPSASSSAPPPRGYTGRDSPCW